MTSDEHAEQARRYLRQADFEFAADPMQASEKLWGAATQAVLAFTTRTGWADDSHRALKTAVERLADESGDPLIAAHFAAAEKFHRNFYHGSMEDFERDADRPKVRAFVDRVLAAANGGAPTP